MSNLFTIDGQSLETAGVSTLNFTWTNQEPDTCTLKLVDGGTPRRQWARDQIVRISRNGQFFFVGWVSSPVAAQTAGDSGLDIIISGAMYLLSRIPFARTVENKKYTSLSLFISPTGGPQTPVQAMQELIEAAQQAGGSALAGGLLAPANMPATPAPEWIEGEYCDVVLRKIAAWCPDSVIWFGYETGQPTLNWTSPGARKSHMFTKGLRPMTAASVNFDSLMAPDAVVIRYDRDHADFQPYADSVFDDVYPPGASVDTPGAAVMTLKAADYLRISFAHQLFIMGRQFKWSGQITTEAEFIDIKPGDAVTISGRPEMAGCNAVVQGVTLSAADMSYQITFGAPRQLGLSDLRDLFWWLQRSGEVTDEVQLTFTPFEVYKETLTTAPFGEVVRIANGYIGAGANQVSPTWQGSALTSEPFERFRSGYSRRFFLKVVWRPDVLEFTGIDELDSVIQGYRPTSTGEIVSAEIVDGREDNEAPSVGLLNGVVFDGTFYFPIADADEVDGELRVVQHRSTSLQCLFVPPNYLYLLGDG